MIDLETSLAAAYPAELAAAAIAAYREIEENFTLKKWKASELDSGHFVEAIRRIIEQELFGSYTPIGKSLPNFSDAELRRYEQARGTEEFRILIPRVLKSIYGIRNKRGVGHLGVVSPNEIDATLILVSAKWVLAELLRLATGVDPSKIQQAVDQVISRRLSVLWKHEGLTRILESSLVAKDQVLVLLYDDNAQSEDQLRTTVEYSNPSKFRAILRTLHKARLIEYRADRKCLITPKGVLRAEELLRELT